MFDSTNRRLISDLAVTQGFEPAAVLAVVKVEGEAVDMADGIQDGKVGGQVMIRWEGHYFWRLLPEAKRVQARRAGLADPKAGKVKNPRSMAARHALLDRARAIDEEAALKSVSMGVGQVMGANFAMCGYRTVFKMWHDAHTLLGQVRMMLGYVKAAGLADELRDARFTPFARGYNGPGYAANRYDKKMEEAYAEFGGKRANVEPIKGVVVRMGDPRRDLVCQVQRRLLTLGYPVRVDGDFGLTTRRHVMAFQAEQGLKADGVVGPKTMEALYAAPVAFALSEERMTASESEVAKGSRIVAKGRVVETVAAGTGAATVASEALPEGWLETALAKSTALRGLYDQVEPMLATFGDFKWVALVVVCGLIAYQARRIIWARVEDHREGKTV